MSKEVFVRDVAVILSVDYSQRAEQIRLSEYEQMAVLGFIKEMKKMKGSSIEIINGATRFIETKPMTNTNWSSIDSALWARNDRAKREEIE